MNEKRSTKNNTTKLLNLNACTRVNSIMVVLLTFNQAIVGSSPASPINESALVGAQIRTLCQLG
jgi:hypothetical protein